MYISSPLVDVFPISKDRNDFPTARALSEGNLIKWHRNICDRDSFVISKEYESDKPFEFMIHGYYIRLLDSAQSSDGKVVSRNLSGMPDGPIYAHIILDKTSSDYPVLYGFDDTNGFTGVLFSSNKTLEDTEMPELINPDTYSLHILDKSGSTYQIPSESLIKFTTTSLETLTVIDGGEDNIQQ